MSGEWIKMRGSLLNNPKVIRIARTLIQDAEFMAWYFGDVRQARHERDVTSNEPHFSDVTERGLDFIPPVTRITVGALLPLWSAVNECAGTNGVLKATDLFEIDTMCGVPGMGYALVKVGWIEVLPNENAVRFLNFHEHNTVGRERSTSAKTNAERQAEHRAKKKAEAEKNNGESNDRSNVTSNRREEKRREDISPVASRFQDFWTAWPNTDRRTRKAECEKKWKAKGLDSIADQILAHVEICKLTRKWQDGYEPAPLTYLNGKLWEDGDPAQADLLNSGGGNRV